MCCPASGDTIEAHTERGRSVMIWKILGLIVVVWLAISVLGAALKGLFVIVFFGALVVGAVWLYKAVTSGDDHRSVGKY